MVIDLTMDSDSKDQVSRSISILSVLPSSEFIPDPTDPVEVNSRLVVYVVCFALMFSSPLGSSMYSSI